MLSDDIGIASSLTDFNDRESVAFQKAPHPCAGRIDNICTYISWDPSAFVSPITRSVSNEANESNPFFASTINVSMRVPK